MMHSLRLRTKFLFLIVGMASFMGIVLTVFVQNFVSDKLSNEFKKRGVVLAEHAASMNTNAILTGDFRSIQINIADLKREHGESVEYIFILDRNKNITAQTFGDSFPIDLITANSLENGQNLSIQPIIAGERRIEDIAIPSLGNGFGEVHVGMKSEVIRQDVNEIISLILAVILSVLLACFIVAIFFSLRISRSISTLAEAALKIEGGDLTVHLEETGTDELGKLSQSFNDMCKGIRGREERLHEQTVQLEEEIAERQQVQEALQEQTAQLEDEVAERREAEKKIHRLNSELEQLNNNLEARVTEVVGELRRKDQILIQQSRLAAMGEMIGNIAHQWRQPLNNVGLIIQNVQLEYDSGTLTREGMDDSISEAMKVIVQMSQTIDDFRNFFREDKEKRGFFISKAVNRALTLVSPSLGNNNIQVKIETDDEVTAIGYQNEYAQVLLNIISNSREAMIERNVPDPCIFIRITRENDRSVLYIRDNCGGIPDDILPKIFDPYFTTRGPDRGTGIGLYMAKVIIEQNMDGRLTARNVDGGAELRIEV